MSFDARLKTSALKLAAAGLALAAVLALAAPPIIRACEAFGGLRHVAALLALAVLGALVYGGAVIAMFGSRWLAGLRRRRARPAHPAHWKTDAARRRANAGPFGRATHAEWQAIRAAQPPCFHLDVAHL